MDKKILFVLFLLLSTAIIAAYLRGNFSSAKSAGAVVKIGKYEFRVEVAETLPAQARGLSGHVPLAPDEGMLFLFGSSRAQSFWMKDMLFAIDIIWIDKGKIVGFAENAPAPTASYTAILNSPAPVDTVFEVAAGTVARTGIKIGDSISINR